MLGIGEGGRRGGRLGLLPTRLSGGTCDLGPLARRKRLRPRLAALQPRAPCGLGLWLERGLEGLLNFARRDPHDVDRVADHIGRALLTFGPRGILTPILASRTIPRSYGSPKGRTDAILIRSAC